jgi:hypothetical protein
MSANLVHNPHAQHGFKDDLESSLYILLWVILMYSTVSDPTLVPDFMASVLDAKPYRGVGGLSKHGLLKGQEFLDDVEFPGRPALHELVRGLANLFKFRYVKAPDTLQRKDYKKFLEMGNGSDDPEFKEALNRQFCPVYDREIIKLESHAATIELFDTALRVCSNWPDMDPPRRQVFADDAATVQQLNEHVLKTQYHDLG